MFSCFLKVQRIDFVTFYRGHYKKLYVSMVKEYNDDEADIYYVTGHILPWGIAGRWANSDDEELTIGYWYIWIYEVGYFIRRKKLAVVMTSVSFFFRVHQRFLGDF